MVNYSPFGCHGCGGRGWVSPNYGVAVKCPICGGSGQSTTKSWPTPNPDPLSPPFIFTCGKCPNAPGPCNCTGACMGLPIDTKTMWAQNKSDEQA